MCRESRPNNVDLCSGGRGGERNVLAFFGLRILHGTHLDSRNDLFTNLNDRVRFIHSARAIYGAVPCKIKLDWVTHGYGAQSRLIP